MSENTYNTNLSLSNEGLIITVKEGRRELFTDAFTNKEELINFAKQIIILFDDEFKEYRKNQKPSPTKRKKSNGNKRKNSKNNGRN